MATVKTIKSSGGDFSTLQAWENWADDQASADQWAECYSGFDMGIIDMQSWTATPTVSLYPRIYAASGHRHDGTTSLNGAYISVVNSSVGIGVRTSYTRVEGIRINADFSGSVSTLVQVQHQTGSTLTGAIIDGCVTRISNSITNINNFFFMASVNSTTSATIRNCIVYHESSSANGAGVGLQSFGSSTNDSSLTANLFNNTIYNTGDCNYGFYFQCLNYGTGTVTSTVTSTNNVSIGPSFDFSAFTSGTVTQTITQTYCCSSDDTADDWLGSGNIIQKTAANCFENPGTNVVPKIGGDIRDAGTTIGSFSTDAIGTSRPQGSAWDIGAMEGRPPNFNGAYNKTDQTHNGYPVYQNGTGVYLFYGEDSGNNYWAIHTSIVDTLASWTFYGDANEVYPLNSGNVWNAGTGTTPGYFYDNPQSSSSSSSEGYSESSSSEGYSDSSNSSSESSESEGNVSSSSSSEVEECRCDVSNNSDYPRINVTMTFSGGGTKTFLGCDWSSGETKAICPDSYSVNANGEYWNTASKDFYFKGDLYINSPSTYRFDGRIKFFYDSNYNVDLSHINHFPSDNPTVVRNSYQISKGYNGMTENQPDFPSSTLMRLLPQVQWPAMKASVTLDDGTVISWEKGGAGDTYIWKQDDNSSSSSESSDGYSDSSVSESSSSESSESEGNVSSSSSSESQAALERCDEACDVTNEDNPKVNVTLTFSGGGTKTFMGCEWTNGETKEICGSYNCTTGGTGTIISEESWAGFSLSNSKDSLQLQGRYGSTTQYHPTQAYQRVFVSKYIDSYNGHTAEFRRIKTTGGTSTQTTTNHTNNMSTHSGRASLFTLDGAIGNNMFGGKVTTNDGITISWARGDGGTSGWGC